MLNEPASSAQKPQHLPPVPPVTEPSLLPLQDSRTDDAIRQHVACVLNILSEQPPSRSSEAAAHEQLRETLALVRSARYLGTFTGALLLDSETAYDQLDAALAPLDAFAVFRQSGNAHVVHVFAGRETPQARSPWINIALFAITFVSVLIVGTEMAISEIAGTGASVREVQALVGNFWGELWRGLPYAIAILLILGAHELGHYFAGRRHRLAVTLPYFIPMPFNAIGTFGAFIQLRQAMRNRKVLLDVGLAGPLMGLVFAIPIVIIGLATSPVKEITPGIVEGNSFLYALIKTLLFGEFLPNGAFDVYVNQLAWAGWTGLLITGLNLIPIGQLDGGHVLYALVGERARRLYLPLMLAMGALVLLTIAISPVWVVWLFLLLFFGRVYAVPLDNITPLDPARRRWALLGLLIFVVTFVPLPLSPIEPSVVLPAGATAMQIAFPAAVALLTLWTRRRRA
jgi:Zn-dependent protease